jgi:hypothetical protein
MTAKYTLGEVDNKEKLCTGEISIVLNEIINMISLGFSYIWDIDPNRLEEVSQGKVP